MSNRAIRKYFNLKPELDLEPASDDEFDVPYVRIQHHFKELSVSSHSESESDHQPDDNESDEEEKPKMKKKKRKNKKKKFSSVSSDVVATSSYSESEFGPQPDDADSDKEKNPKIYNKKGKNKRKKRYSNVSSDMDEIDRCVQEVNEILGGPPEPPIPAEEKPINPEDVLMGINPKFLDANLELTRLFGPEERDPDTKKKRKPRRPLRRVFVTPISDFNYNYQKDGLSMSILKVENGLKYFRYDHTKYYQRKVHEFLSAPNFRDMTYIVMPSYEERQNNMQMEVLLEYAKIFFLADDYTAGNNVIEEIISYMQCMAHASFKFTDRTVRLEYKYVENRAFHVAFLKYLHLLTNKACHRTALEIAKILLNLDPSDPLAVIFIVDTLAIRAREYEWLIEIVDYWTTKKEVKMLFNIQFSYALAHFHLALKNKEDTDKADSLLQEAMLRFPIVPVKILESVNSLTRTAIPKHDFFNTMAEKSTSKNLKELIGLYAKFIYPKWRETPVLTWLLRNINIFVEKYDSDSDLRARAEQLSVERMSIFPGWPSEIIRHLNVIRDLSNLLVDGAVPPIRMQISCNPEPPSMEDIDRYKYFAPMPEDDEPNPALSEWLRAIML